MNELELTYSPYRLKFKYPFATSRQIFKERKGFIIEVSDKAGIKGIGDAAPFELFGSESYEHTEQQLAEFKLKLELKEDIAKSLKDFLIPYTNFPALRHGVEQAVLSYICNKTKLKINELLGFDISKEINVNYVIGFYTPKDSAKIAKTAVNEGFNTIKVKLGREKFADDEAVIKEIRNSTGESINLRIDVNGKWNLSEAIENLNSLAKYSIQYAEEPVSGLENFISLAGETSIPLAPDESLRTIEDAKVFVDSKVVSYLILKPMMLGGLISTIEIVKLAKKNNITPVITSSLESAIGRVNAVVAAAVTKSGIAHGIGTANLFEKDLMDDPYPITNGKIKL